jgi:hypothetical protein
MNRRERLCRWLHTAAARSTVVLCWSCGPPPPPYPSPLQITQTASPWRVPHPFASRRTSSLPGTMYAQLSVPVGIVGSMGSFRFVSSSWDFCLVLGTGYALQRKESGKQIFSASSMCSPRAKEKLRKKSKPFFLFSQRAAYPRRKRIGCCSLCQCHSYSCVQQAPPD